MSARPGKTRTVAAGDTGAAESISKQVNQVGEGAAFAYPTAPREASFQIRANAMPMPCEAMHQAARR